MTVLLRHARSRADFQKPETDWELEPEWQAEVINMTPLDEFGDLDWVNRSEFLTPGNYDSEEFVMMVESSPEKTEKSTRRRP